MPSVNLTSKRVEQFFEQFFRRPDITPFYNGASVVVVKDAKVIAKKGYGFKDTDKRYPINPDETVFRLASVSKVFTAIAIMQLVDKKKINLKDDIRNYLGDISFHNPFSEPVTVEHLLLHTTGFENSGDITLEDQYTNFENFIGMKDYILNHMPSVIRKPGTSYMYDNFASLLQGYIIELVSKIPFQEYMMKYIFEPLEMNCSSFLPDSELRDRMATAHDMWGNPINPYVLNPTVMPNGGMVATVKDIGKFMSFFLNGNKVNPKTERLLTSDTIHSMTIYRTAIHELLPDSTYGFEAPFQIPGARNDSKVIAKAGNINGYDAYMWMIPKENFGVFVAVNQNGLLTNMLYSDFMKQFYPDYVEPIDEHKSYNSSGIKNMDEYIGIYMNLRIKNILITIDQNQSGEIVISDTLLGRRVLRPIERDLFIDTNNNQLVAFKRGSDGMVSYVKESLSPNSYATKIKESGSFPDVGERHPYARYIHTLQYLGFLERDIEKPFEPERSVTRAEYIHTLIKIMDIKISENQVEFQDTLGHPYEKEIQTAKEMGFVTGNSEGFFEPNRPITREEAAVIIWRSFAGEYSGIDVKEVIKKVRIFGDTSKWAVSAVKMMVALGIHGPEVYSTADGSVNFNSKRAMTRAEEAAHHFMMLTKPMVSIKE